MKSFASKRQAIKIIISLYLIGICIRPAEFIDKNLSIDKSDGKPKVLEPKDLQSTDGTVYFDDQIANPSVYSVYGYRHAGGYIGKADMGSTATVGGINLLKKVLDLARRRPSPLRGLDLLGGAGAVLRHLDLRQVTLAALHIVAALADIADNTGIFHSFSPL